MTDGAKANRTGNTLERFVEQTLLSQGYLRVPDRGTAFDERTTMPGKHFASQVPIGTTVYETRRRCDFLVLNPITFPEGLVIECKWQQSSGSVDEKFPFLLLNIDRSKIPTIVLLDGSGFKPAAKTWLLDQSKSHPLLRAVWSMSEFHAAVNDGLLL